MTGESSRPNKKTSSGASSSASLSTFQPAASSARKQQIITNGTSSNTTNTTNTTTSESIRSKLVPESNDFKLVFISSDSSKDSDQLNSSLENCPEHNNNNNNGNACHGSWPHGNEEEFIVGDCEMEYDEHFVTISEQNRQNPPNLPPKLLKKKVLKNQNQNNKNLNLDHFGDRMSLSTSGTSIRTAATRDRHSPVLRSPKMPKIRNIPVQKAMSMDDRSLTEMSIHDMQMVLMHPIPNTGGGQYQQDSSVLSRSLSESDLSEICGIGGATGSDPPSPVNMMAPSDDEFDAGMVL